MFPFPNGTESHERPSHRGLVKPHGTATSPFPNHLVVSRTIWLWKGKGNPSIWRFVQLIWAFSKGLYSISYRWLFGLRKKSKMSFEKVSWPPSVCQLTTFCLPPAPLSKPLWAKGQDGITKCTAYINFQILPAFLTPLSRLYNALYV